MFQNPRISTITMYLSYSIKTAYLFFLGSVNGGNCAELAKEEDIDGFLVGGASLKVLLNFICSLLLLLCSTFKTLNLMSMLKEKNKEKRRFNTIFLSWNLYIPCRINNKFNSNSRASQVSLRKWVISSIIELPDMVSVLLF